MECGQRLFGVLELGGAIIITTGYAIRTAIQKLCESKTKKSNLNGNNVLIIGADELLQNELAKQFIVRGCHVARAGLVNVKNDQIVKFYVCNPTKPKQLENLAKQLEEDYGKLDIVIHTTEISRSHLSEPIDEIVDIIENNLMENFHVASQFVPDLARRSGYFVTVEPQKTKSDAFSATKTAISSLSNVLTRQINSNIHIIQAHRRVKRRSDEDNIQDSAKAILSAIENGQSSVTLPTAKQHIKNIIRHLFSEISLFWKDTVTQQKINKPNEL